MFIKSLTIKNFRSFGKGANDGGTTIEFNDTTTAIIGCNGSGKTTILEALNYLIGQDYLQTKISEKDFHCEASDIKDQIVIEGETIKPFFLDVDVVSNYEIASTVVIPCKKIRLTIKRRERAENVLDTPFIINKTVVPMIGNIDNVVYKELNLRKKYEVNFIGEIEPPVKSLESAKEIIKRLLEGQATEIQHFEKYYQVKFKIKSGEERTADFPEYNLIYNPNRIRKLAKSYYLTKDRDNDVSGSYSFISKILTDLHWRYKRKECKDEEKTIPENYGTLSSSLRNIIDEKGKLIRKINDIINKISSERKDFQIDFIDIEQPYQSAFIAKNEKGKLLLPDNLGSGFNILIAYALFSYVADQEKVPIVLIIDEPELHLHSDWQKKMYNTFVKQQNIQIVYSTQSENFVSLKNWQQIRIIKDNEILPRQSSEQITASDGDSGTLKEFLGDYAEKNFHISLILKENLELFFTKKCILVEGPGEKYALPKLLELNGCNINNYSVSIIPAWGKTKIKVYQMICKYFNIDFYTIYDQDKKEDNEPDKENGFIENNVLQDQLYAFSTNFEDRLGINGNHKFQKLVKLIDELSDIESLDNEIQECIKKVTNFITKDK